MSTNDFTPDTADLTLDEITTRIHKGELDIDELDFTDEQAAEAEKRATITLSELHGALDTLFGDEADEDSTVPDNAVDIMFTAILGVIVESRESAAFLGALMNLGSLLGEDDLDRILFGDGV